MEKLDQARTAILATVGDEGIPHLVPVVFAVLAEGLITAVDGKPKGSLRLQRLTNIERDPRVSLLVHHYEEDWTNLWWIRIEGMAAVVPEHSLGEEALRAKYPQYRSVPLPGPFIAIDIIKRREWAANPQPRDSQ